MEREFDLVVIGAGPAGEIAGRLSERGGKEVAIVDRDLAGGECSFYACMPSKALLRPAEALREVARIPGAAEALTGELDVEAVLARRDQSVNDLDDSNQVPWLAARNIELVRGAARLDGERRVRVDFLQAATITIVGQIPLSTLAHAIAPFPTRSELWLKFLEAYEREHETTLHAERTLIGVGA